jgi:hypothetical protein
MAFFAAGVDLSGQQVQARHQLALIRLGLAASLAFFLRTWTSRKTL